jgi:uncharacterized protein with PQ loop repeat
MNLVLNVIVVAASVLGSGMALPQARRLAKTRNVAGVSATWIGVSMAINIWWTVYAFATSLWAILPVSTVSLLLYLGMAAFYVHSVGPRALRGLAVGALGLGMIPLPVLLVSGWHVAGLAIGLSYGIQLAPAVTAAFRTRHLDGVAPGTWIMSFVEGLLWLAYGAMISDLALLAGGAMGVVMSGALLLRLAAVGSVADLIRVVTVTRVKVARN